MWIPLCSQSVWCTNKYMHFSLLHIHRVISPPPQHGLTLTCAICIGGNHHIASMICSSSPVPMYIGLYIGLSDQEDYELLECIMRATSLEECGGLGLQHTSTSYCRELCSVHSLILHKKDDTYSNKGCSAISLSPSYHLHTPSYEEVLPERVNFDKVLESPFPLLPFARSPFPVEEWLDTGQSAQKPFDKSFDR